jgi:hypothetical protein
MYRYRTYKLDDDRIPLGGDKGEEGGFGFGEQGVDTGGRDPNFALFDFADYAGFSINSKTRKTVGWICGTH